MRNTAYTGHDRAEWSGQVSDVRVSYSEAVSAREQATLAALTRRCSTRGFYRAAEQHIQEMDSMEEEARTISPNHYRWDEFCADGRGANFRHGNYLGRQVMDVDDFAAYFETCRTRRPLNEQASVAAPAREQQAAVPARTRAESSYARAPKSTALERKQETRVGTVDRVIAVAKDWLQPDDPSLRRRGLMQRVPVSVISVLVVIAVSLMMIVSSSVMVASAKREVSRLDDEVSALSKEAELATDRFEASINYLEIYQLATERYGMIPASFANSLYVDKAQGNTIENFESEEEETLGLSTLLSAIGIRFGDAES